MILKKLWYYSFKAYLQIGLHFYTNRIKIEGKENIPKRGALLFAANHPNALLDPLYIAAFNPRELHFLVRADVFKKPIIKKLLSTLNLMPIYRIRDGRNEMANNQAIFEKCYNILSQRKSLLIFPQGGHSRDRTIPILSKGFTRILIGAIEQQKDLQIHIVPVGITYQNASKYPSKVCLRYGQPINVNAKLQSDSQPETVMALKEEVRDRLKELSVHIPKNGKYQETLTTLNKANIDFTNVETTNRTIQSKDFPKPKSKKTHILDFLYYPLLLNNIIPYLIWKITSKKIKDIEFVDTFRFGINLILTPIFLVCQSILLSAVFDSEIGFYYCLFSVLMILLFTKTSSTNTEHFDK